MYIVFITSLVNVFSSSLPGLFSQWQITNCSILFDHFTKLGEAICLASGEFCFPFLFLNSSFIFFSFFEMWLIITFLMELNSNIFEFYFLQIPDIFTSNIISFTKLIVLFIFMLFFLPFFLNISHHLSKNLFQLLLLLNAYAFRNF